MTAKRVRRLLTILLLPAALVFAQHGDLYQPGSTSTAPTPQPTYSYTAPTPQPTYAYTAPTPQPTTAPSTDSFTIQIEADNGSGNGASTLAANSTYTFAGDGGYSGTSNSTRFRHVVPIAATLKAVYFYISVAGTLGTSGQTVTHKVFKNGSAATSGAVFAYSADPSTGNQTGLSVSFAAGDVAEIQVTTPNPWTTAATGVRGYATLYFSVP